MLFRSEDTRQVKIFVFIDEIGPENGPFTFISESSSKKVCRFLGSDAPGRRKLSQYNGEHGPGERLNDDDVFQICNRDEVNEVVGSAGSGLACATGRCLHFGSRCKKGERLIFMFQFLPINVFREASTRGKGSPDFPIDRYINDRYRYEIIR